MERSRVSSLLFVQLEEASTASQSDSDVRCATPPSKGDGDIILSSEGPKDEETPAHPVDNARKDTLSGCEEHTSSSPDPPPVQEVGPANH